MLSPTQRCGLRDVLCALCCWRFASGMRMELFSGIPISYNLFKRAYIYSH